MNIFSLIKSSLQKYDSHSYFKKYVTFVRENNLYPPLYRIDGPSTAPHIVIDGKKYLTFASNNYLSVANMQPINDAVIEGVKRYGVGSGSTRLLSGTLDIQQDFEKELADFFGFEDSITFSSGFLANTGTLRMLVDPFPYFTLGIEGKGLIISDELNHASIIDAVRLAKADRVVYPHSDMVALEKILKKHVNRRKVIVTDGIFSMDGDTAKLDEITALAKKYNALTFVDDSHGVGVLGKNGRGCIEIAGVEGKVDILMGSFTKAFGSIGGFIACSKEVADYLRITNRSYIFSDPIPPALVHGLSETLRIMKGESGRREKVLKNAAYLREQFRVMGYSVLGDTSSIVPVLTTSEEKGMALSKYLYERGVLAPCIRRPAVKVGAERIRISVMHDHTQEDFDTLLKLMEEGGKKVGILT